VRCCADASSVARVRWRSSVAACARRARGALRERAGEADPRYTIDAILDPGARTIAGTVERGRQYQRAPAPRVALVLYPNRFADARRAGRRRQPPYVYPREEFVAGGITSHQLERATRPSAAACAAGTAARRRRRLPGDAAARRAPDARSRPARRDAARALPYRLAGALRAVRRRRRPRDRARRLVPDAAVAAVRRHVGPRDAAPPAACTAAAGAADLQVFDRRDARSRAAAESFDFDVPAGSPPTLFAAEDYEAPSATSTTPIVALCRAAGAPPSRSGRASPTPSRVLDADERIVRRAARRRSAALQRRSSSVEAPLRSELTAPGGPSLAVISDRALAACTVCSRVPRARARAGRFTPRSLGPDRRSARAPSDAPWVVEVVSAGARRPLGSRRRIRATGRSTTGSGLFNVFAIVDRFESAPKLPFGRAFFPNEGRHASEMRDDRESLGTRPAARPGDLHQAPETTSATPRSTRARSLPRGATTRFARRGRDGLAVVADRSSPTGPRPIPSRSTTRSPTSS
jgi:hypothetical protein